MDHCPQAITILSPYPPMKHPPDNRNDWAEPIPVSWAERTINAVLWSISVAMLFSMVFMPDVILYFLPEVK